MQVKIIETGKIKSLNAIDARSGCDYTGDLIGNTGAFNADQFRRELDADGDEITDYWVASQAEYDWWHAVIADYNKADQLKQEAKALGLWSDEDEANYQSIETNDMDCHSAACREYCEAILANRR